MQIVRFPTRQTENNTTTDPILITIDEARAMTRYSRVTVWRKVKAGDWRSVGSGRGRRIVLASIHEWLERQAS